MIRISTKISAFTIAAACCLLQPASVSAQISPALHNDKILVEYYEPRDQSLLPLYMKLQGRQVLEELSQFLAPVHWPKTLRLIAKECPVPQQLAPQVFYSKIEYSLTICYQFLSFLGSLNPPPAFASQQQVVVGGLVGTVLHEAGRAVFDMFSVPLLGSEDDAADQLMAFAALQFTDDVAQAVVKGSYFVWQTYDGQIAGRAGQSGGYPRYDWASPRTVPAQRMDNILCIAYGRPSSTFKSFVDQGNLLSTRAAGCAAEYEQARKAFVKTIVPAVDADMMSKALSMTWLTADDLK
jgi:hypothetical protein